jgi:pimeloyl-ACP methyl ester carboxylesterase
MPNKNNISSDLQGITSLLADATLGVTDVVEEMHNRVTHPPFLPSTPIQHLVSKIAGITFNNIRWSTKFIGKSSVLLLKKIEPMLGSIKSTKDKEVLKAVLNGVVGDHLEKNKNPIKINMGFRYNTKTILLNSKKIKDNYPKITGKIILLVHGSCMNDIQWTRKEHNHGELLAKELDKTVIYLHYNSGRHISTNGQELNELLEELIQEWPVFVEELTIIAHSMGGLVSRSAVYYGEKKQNTWTKFLKKIIFLGTPHHGAPMEQAGNYLDIILEAIPYAKPFAKLGKIRSAGVTDLRYGNLIDEDWQHRDRFEMQGDQRNHISIPKGIKCYSVAGVVGVKAATISSQLLGDNMVGLKSALGKHKNADKNLFDDMEDTWIAYENNHVDLLNSAKVYAKIKSWMVS